MPAGSTVSKARSCTPSTIRRNFSLARDRTWAANAFFCLAEASSSRRALRSLYLRHDLAGEDFDGPALERSEASGLVVDDAERADRLASLDAQRIPGVKADEGRAEDESVFGEERFFSRVFDDEETLLLDRVGAEGHLDGRFRWPPGRRAP